jgi:hypothetical protein
MLRPYNRGFRVLCEVPGESAPPEEEFVPLFNGKSLLGWGNVWNPDGVAERFTVVTEEDEPALRSPDKGRMSIRSGAHPYEYYHLRLEVKFSTQSAGKRYLTIHHQSAGARGLMLVLEKGPAAAMLKPRGEALFDEATLTGGRIEVKQQEVKELSFPASVLREPGQWNSVEIFCLGDEAVYRINGRVVGAIANLREVKPDDKVVPIMGGDVTLGAGPGTMFFRKIEMRPLVGLPADLPDGP